jgi:uncharacterized membrane protein YgcG
MKTFVLTIALFFFGQIANAQSATIQGIVKDSAQQPFDAATIVLFNLKDSSVAHTTVTNKEGKFEIKQVPVGSYRVYISSVQFNSTTKDVTISPNTAKINLGTINVLTGRKLEDVTVVANNPIRVTTDTVEFRADAFKTRPNAVVEDLLKKLPGVEVDKEGNIKAGGQQVTKVLVDGKPFFGNDPKTATKNLPANIVDKVQVIDKKSDQAQFTGFDDGTTEKVINVTIKKDKKKGFFGRANVGYGTDDRYESNLSFNRFNNGLQLSVIGQANNINQEGFSFQDIMDFNGSGGFGGGRGSDAGGTGGGMGGGSIMMVRGGGGSFGGQSFGGTPAGLKDTKAGGINFSNSFGKKLTLSSSYFYNQSKTITENTSNRVTFSADTSLQNTNDQNSTNTTIRGNHRINFDMDLNIDSFNSILIRPNLTFVENETESNTFNKIVGKSGVNNTSNQNTINNNNQTSLSGTALWRHKTRIKGRTLSVRLNAGTSNTDGEGANITNQNVTGGGSAPANFNFDQIYNTDRRSNTYNVRATYTEPLSKTRILELFYVKGGNLNASERLTYNKNMVTNIYNIFDSIQSNQFDNDFKNQQLGFNVQTKLKKYDYTLGMAVQESDLISKNILKNTTLEQKNIFNLFPTARLNFNLSKNKRLNFNYRGNTNQPTASQLQPVIDRSNPLNVREGNPALKQEFNNSVSAMYNVFNFITMKNFFTTVMFNNTSNKIVDSIVNTRGGAQFRKPTNVNGAYNALASINFGFPIKGVKGLNLNINNTTFYNNDVNITDGQKNLTKLINNNQRININYNYKDKLDVMFSFNSTYNNTKYSANSNANNKFFNYTTTADVSYMFKNNLALQTDIDYYIYTGRGAAFNQKFALWNATISKMFLKDKSLEIKATAFDILKQNKAINRTVQETYVEDSRSNILTQYFMISAKYNLSKFGGKGAKSFSMPKLPGMRQMNNMRIGL